MVPNEVLRGEPAQPIHFNGLVSIDPYPGERQSSCTYRSWNWGQTATHRGPGPKASRPVAGNTGGFTFYEEGNRISAFRPRRVGTDDGPELVVNG